MKNLKFNIFAYESLKQYTVIVLKSIEPELKSLKGKKIKLSNGEFSKKFTLESSHSGSRVQFEGEDVYLQFNHWYIFDMGGLVLKTKVCLSKGSYDTRTNYVKYHTRDTFIGAVDNQVLTQTSLQRLIESLSHNNPIDINVFLDSCEEIKKLRVKISEIEKDTPYFLREYLPKY